MVKLLRVRLRARVHVDHGHVLRPWLVEVLGRATMLKKLNDPLARPSVRMVALAMCQCGLATQAEWELLQRHIHTELRELVCSGSGSEVVRQTCNPVFHMSSESIFSAVGRALNEDQ